MAASTIDTSLLKIDPRRVAEEIEASIYETVVKRFGRKGAVVGVSGGIDSSVVVALCTRALGPERVLGLFMPEADSSGESLQLGRKLAETFGFTGRLEDITSTLQAAGCYERRDEAIRKVVPEYGSGYRSKIALPDHPGATYAIYYLVYRTPDGTEKRVRLTAEAYLGIVAATNFKQRVRKMMEYHHADRLHYAVAGTPNRLEYDLGFFVKLGDGAADLKPIAHLYKSQVYQLAEYLGVPEEIRLRPPTTDTYSLPQSQEEFYFTLPLDKMDLCLYGKDQGIPEEKLAPDAGLTVDAVRRTYQMIDSRRRATGYLHAPPVLVKESEQ